MSYNQLAPSNGALIENNTYSRSENKLRTPKNRLFKLSRIKRFKAAAVRSNVPKITTTDYDNAKEDEGATQREDDGCESSGSAGSTCEEGPRERTRTRTIETALEPSETHKVNIHFWSICAALQLLALDKLHGFAWWACSSKIFHRFLKVLFDR